MLSGTHFLSSEQAGVRSRSSPCAVCQESCPEEGLCNHADSLSLEERDERHLGTSSRLQVTQDTAHQRGHLQSTKGLRMRLTDHTSHRKTNTTPRILERKPNHSSSSLCMHSMFLQLASRLVVPDRKKNAASQSGNDGCLIPSLASLHGSGTASIRVLE